MMNRAAANMQVKGVVITSYRYQSSIVMAQIDQTLPACAMQEHPDGANNVH
jgi:hypothetical protein